MLTTAQVASAFGTGFLAGLFLWAVASVFTMGREALKCAMVE